MHENRNGFLYWAWPRFSGRPSATEQEDDAEARAALVKFAEIASSGDGPSAPRYSAGGRAALVGGALPQSPPRGSPEWIAAFREGCRLSAAPGETPVFAHIPDELLAKLYLDWPSWSPRNKAAVQDTVSSTSSTASARCGGDPSSSPLAQLAISPGEGSRPAMAKIIKNRDACDCAATPSSAARKSFNSFWIVSSVVSFIALSLLRKPRLRRVAEPRQSDQPKG